MAGTITGIILAVGILLVSCDSGQETMPRLEPVGEWIQPEPSDGIVLARAETPNVSIQADDEEDTGARVRLSDEFVLLSTFDVNLDIDEPDEQIIVVKNREDPSDRIRLLIADYDTLRNAYRITWEGMTHATGVRSFSVQVTDVVGDHQDEIVAVGTDNEGNQTTDIFRRREASVGASGLAYRQIFGGVADGSIEIVEERRSDAYRTLQSAGESFPIITFRRNEETDNPLDLIRTEYRWSAEHELYVMTVSEEVSGGEVEQEQLRELYDADVETMEQFLQGPWFRSTGPDIGAAVELALFDHAEQELTLFHRDTQERYDWLNSYKTLYDGGPGLWINTRNQVLRTVRRQLSVVVIGLDSIRITVDGAEYWNGRYQRMTSGIRNSVLKRYELEEPDFTLRGVFRNENDDEILFEEPHFRFRSSSFVWSGGYNVITLGQPLLELKVIEATGEALPDGIHRISDQNGGFNARYILDYGEQRSEDRIVRRLTMQPARLTVDGVEPVSGESYVLEQVEDFLIGE